MRSLGQIILEEEKSKKQKEYADFFKEKLAEYGADSPADLSTGEKKKFFNEIESEWDGEVSEMVKADNEDQENGNGAGKEVSKDMGDGDESSDEIEDKDIKKGKPTTSGEGDEVVNDDQEITAKVTEALSGITEAGDVKLMKRKLDSIVGSTLKKIIDELAKKGFSKEEIEKYMEIVVSDRVEESFKKVNESDADGEGNMASTEK